MKWKNDSIPKQHDKEDLGFLDDRMQLLDTVRQMIDIEFKRRGVNTGGNPHPENPPPYYIRGQPPGRELSEDKPSRPSLWQRIMGIFTGSLSDNEDM